MGGWGWGLGSKVIWHAHGWFFLYVNVASPWLIFSTHTIVLEISILYLWLSICLPPSSPAFPLSIRLSHSHAVNLLLSLSVHNSTPLVFFLSHFVSARLMSAAAKHQSEAVWFQPPVFLTQRSDSWHKPSVGLSAFKSITCQSALSLTFTQTKMCC